MGNAFYSSFQYLKAEEHFLKATELRQTERVLESLAWLEGIYFDRDQVGVQFCDKCLVINSNNLAARYIKAQCCKNEV